VPAAVFADVVHAADVLMVEPRGRLGLVLEAAERLFVVGLVVRKDFYGDDAIEHRIERAKHRAHAAAADKLQQLEMAERLTQEHAAHLQRLQVARDRRETGGGLFGDDCRLIVDANDRGLTTARC
jgi:hypothetical protein